MTKNYQPCQEIEKCNPKQESINRNKHRKERDDGFGREEYYNSYCMYIFQYARGFKEKHKHKKRKMKNILKKLNGISTDES